MSVSLKLPSPGRIPVEGGPKYGAVLAASLHSLRTRGDRTQPPEQGDLSWHQPLSISAALQGPPVASSCSLGLRLPQHRPGQVRPRLLLARDRLSGLLPGPPGGEIRRHMPALSTRGSIGTHWPLGTGGPQGRGPESRGETRGRICHTSVAPQRGSPVPYRGQNKLKRRQVLRAAEGAPLPMRRDLPSCLLLSLCRGRVPGDPRGHACPLAFECCQLTTANLIGQKGSPQPDSSHMWALLSPPPGAGFPPVLSSRPSAPAPRGTP